MGDKAKVKVVNQWFRPVSLNDRKTCPTCKAKVRPNEIHSWVVYRNAKARLVDYFCRSCYKEIVCEPATPEWGEEIVLNGQPVWFQRGNTTLVAPDGATITFPEGSDLGIVADWCEEHGHFNAAEYRRWSKHLTPEELRKEWGEYFIRKQRLKGKPMINLKGKV